MKNFIRHNIENIKGTRRPSSLIDKQSRDMSANKTKLNVRPSPYRQQLTNDKVRRLQQELSSLKSESHIVEDLNDIKSDIKLIKSYLFGSGSRVRFRMDDHSHRRNSEEKEMSKGEEMDEQETLYPAARQVRMKSYGSEADQFGGSHDHYRVNLRGSNNPNSPQKRVYKVEDILEQKMKKSGSVYNKSGISLKSLMVAVKDYKLEGPENGSIYFGYAKRNSQPVAVKYIEDKIEQVIEVYDRLWKNIAKAEWPCINRIYDYKADQANILIMERNKSNIIGLPFESILVDLVKIMEFIHDCGYLYRNIEPEHIMLNQQGQLVVIDFKRARRYVDIRGHPIEVLDSIYTGSPFASNNQVRGLPESRKDDLESIGYLALLLHEMEIPWGGMSRDQVIKVRSGLTLQELFKDKPQWIEFMAYVVRLPKNERPDYRYLCQAIGR